MKIFTLATVLLFSVLVSVMGEPTVKTWTYFELEHALKTANPEEKPYLLEVYNTIIYSLFTNQFWNLTRTNIPSPSGSSKWTFKELDRAMKDPATNPQHKRAMELSYGYLAQSSGTEKAVEVYMYAMDISKWTLKDLDAAIVNPYTNAELLPYLEKARTKLTTDPEFKNKDTIGIVTPVGLAKLSRKR